MPLKFPEGLKDRDAVVIVSNHMQYLYTHKQDLIKHLENVELIMDNMGAWKDVHLPSRIKYYEAGMANWL